MWTKGCNPKPFLDRLLRRKSCFDTHPDVCVLEGRSRRPALLLTCPTGRSTTAAFLLLLCVALFAGCRSDDKKPAPAGSNHPPSAAAPATPPSAGVSKTSAPLPTKGTQDDKAFLTPEGLDYFDLKAHPDAIVMQPLDPATMTDSERKYGRSPHPDPKVEYQPGIILMEEGDKAIRGFSSNGLIWNFDAHAPHVNEFQEGKIVFATSRAVGKILYMKQEGDTVSVILGPIQLMDVIHKGEFAMNAPLDLSKALPFVTPEYPQTKDNDAVKNVSVLQMPGVHMPQTIVFSHISRSGKWTPFSMAKVARDGTRVGYEKIGKAWVAMPQSGGLGVGGDAFAPPAVAVAEPRMLLGQGPPRLVRAGYQQQSPLAPNTLSGIPLPGTGLRVPMVPYMPKVDIPPIPNIPQLNLTNQLTAVPVGTWNSIGVQWSYEKNGVGMTATAIIKFDGAHAAFDIAIGMPNRPPVECGIDISATVSLHLQLLAHTKEEFHISGQSMQKFWIPASLSIPLAGNVPLAVNFDQAVVYNTGFSAKNAVLDAEGIYTFTGGIKAKYTSSDGFTVKIPTSITADTDIARSAQGVSVGINSLVMSAEFRATAGLGTAGFATGVYADLIYTGTILKSPDIGFPCRAGTIEAWVYPGLGYSIPGWLTDAINAVIAFFTPHRIEKAGSFLKGDGTRLFHGDTSIPSKCATPKG